MAKNTKPAPLWFNVEVRFQLDADRGSELRYYVIREGRDFTAVLYTGRIYPEAFHAKQLGTVVKALHRRYPGLLHCIEITPDVQWKDRQCVIDKTAETGLPGGSSGCEAAYLMCH